MENYRGAKKIGPIAIVTGQPLVGGVQVAPPPYFFQSLIAMYDLLYILKNMDLKHMHN